MQLSTTHYFQPVVGLQQQQVTLQQLQVINEKSNGYQMRDVTIARR
jgi:hypothetical protein